MALHGNGDKKARQGRARKITQHSLEGFGVPSQITIKAGWDECTSECLQAAVVAVTRLGGALLFGKSRDGGALSLTVMLNDERKTVWINGDADLDEELMKISEYFTQLE